LRDYYVILDAYLRHITSLTRTFFQISNCIIELRGVTFNMKPSVKETFGTAHATQPACVRSPRDTRIFEDGIV
jgi:hypothetical protein